ncbi:carbohydrate kinase family protein [Chloroflexi bacterium TSY]|nr:carbohydrate kinase family protein [Chloroflexi bacterium TSY]
MTLISDAHLLIIGTVSIDKLHLGSKIATNDNDDQNPVTTVGGAGMYTALAARKAGAQVTLLAPQPTVMLDVLAPIAAKITWVGPEVDADSFPRLEIAHHGGGQATLIDAAWGAEARLQAAELYQFIPHDLSSFDSVHIAALSSAQRQLDFLRACHVLGAKRTSVGTYARSVYGETDTVQTLLHDVALFFMNENEAAGLIGYDGTIESLQSFQRTAQMACDQLLFVTLGRSGAWVVQNSTVSHIPAPVAQEIDPTGAGDTFCGATLAVLAQGLSPVSAAQQACQLASLMIENIGPTALL